MLAAGRRAGGEGRHAARDRRSTAEFPGAEVFRRCAQNILQHAQRATNQVRVFQFSNSYREVETLANEIDTAVRDAEVELDVRIAFQERARPCRDQRTSERTGHGDPKHATYVARSLHDVIGFLDRAQMRGNVFIISGAFGRRAERARRALQQAYTETLFEARDAFRYG